MQGFIDFENLKKFGQYFEDFMIPENRENLKQP